MSFVTVCAHAVSDNVFLCSVLGMNLFGCKFCRKLRNGTEFCDRKNFDTLLWSIITVFQVYSILSTACLLPTISTVSLRLSNACVSGLCITLVLY